MTANGLFNAHDLRTPRIVMLAQAELLEGRLKRDPSTPVDPVGGGTGGSRGKTPA